MSIAEELAKKFGARTGSNTVEFLDRNFRAAINEALERAAQECEAAEPGFKSTAAKLGTI